MRDDAGEGAPQERLVHHDDLVDDVADDVERDGVGIEIAGEAVGERRADVDGDETARRRGSS